MLGLIFMLVKTYLTLNQKLVMKGLKISKLSGLYTILTVVFVLGVVFAEPCYAQKKKKDKGKKEKPIKRPKPVGNKEVDDFVNNSFNIYQESCNTNKKLDEMKYSVANLAAGETQEIERITKEVKVIQNNSKKVDDRVNGLLKQAPQVLSGAQNITPKINSIKAVKNINTAKKALVRCAENLKDQPVLTKEVLESLAALKK